MATRTTKRLTTARTAFQSRVIDFIVKLGAIKSDRLYDFTIATPAGEVGISVWESAIMCRFSNVDAGTEFSTINGCGHTSNPYSGKWNWHYPDDADTLNAVCERDFIRYFERLMDWSQ
jgi:hypothetical protein